MLKFAQFITEEKVSSNTKGVLHELLVGYHLNGGKHMINHKNKESETPQQVHDKLAKSISHSDYQKINKAAKIAADDIKTKLNGNKIKHVHWTSKPGDLEKSTGIKASQKEDASDIVITTHDKTHKSGVRHYGVSLKVSDTSSKIPISNPGIESTYGGKELLDKHREELKRKYPALAKAKNKAERKKYMSDNPHADREIKELNKNILTNIAKNTHKKLTEMPHEDMINHIRNHIIKASKTPMEHQGHVHIRHTTYTNKAGNVNTHSVSPSKDYEHILNDHKNITIHHSGASIVFKHKGKTFARHRLKFTSQSDPFSSIKGSGSDL